MIAAMKDPVGRFGLRAAFHVRRYSAMYALGVIAIIAVLLMPTVAETAHPGLLAGGSGNGQQGAGQAASAPAAAGAGAAAAAGPGATTAGAGAGPIGSVAAATGTTRGGFTCSPGVHQIPWSEYTPQCVAAFQGNNGWATWNGVTGTTITLVMRHCADASGPNEASATALAEQAGGESLADEETHVKQIIAYFNRTFELYGRHVQVVDYSGQSQSQCSSTEATGGGQTAAQADADYEANTMHAFTDLNYAGLFESEVFAQQAAHYHMYLGFAQLYFPESEFRAEDPYIWAPPPSCTIGGADFAEFVGKQIMPFPTQWAGTLNGVPLNGKPRKLGVYIPGNEGYNECEKNTRTIDQQKYGIPAKNDCGATQPGCRWDIYKYSLDISTWEQGAQQAATQFAADQDTTVVLSSDQLSPIFLTQDAHAQQYFPEWLLTGVALTDQDNLAQIWYQTEIKGHLFGL